MRASSGGGGLQVGLLQQVLGAGHELGVVVGQDALPVVHIVLHAHAQVAAHGDGGQHDGQVAVADAAGRPGGALRQHVAEEHQVFHRAGQAAGAAQDDLEVAGGLEHAGLDVVDGVLDHAAVEDFDFRLDVALLEGIAQLLQEGGRVHEHGAVLPVQGTRIVGGQLGQQLLQGIDALLVPEVHTAGAGDVDADVAVLVGADALHGLLVLGKVGGGRTVVVAHMDVGNGGARLPAVVHVLGDGLRGEGDVGVVVVGGPGAGDSYRDNALSFQIRHEIFLLKFQV